MNNSKLLLYTAGTVILVIATIFVTSKQETTSETTTTLPESLIPGVEEKLDSIGTIALDGGTPTQSVTLLKQGEEWRLKEKDNYYVDAKKVEEFLLGFRTVKPLEQKTGNPERYKDLGVQQPDGTNPDAGLITLSDESDVKIASIILGNNALSVAGQTRRYVRIPEQKNAWLVETSATINTTQDYWMEKQIMDIPMADFNTFSVTHWSGEVLDADKPTTDSAWILAGIPEGKVLKNESELNNYPRTFQRMNLEQVRKLDPAFSDTLTSQTTILATTFNGLELTTTLANDPASKQWWATFSTRYDDLLRNQDAASQPVEDAKKQAETLNTRLANWHYQLPEWKVEIFTKGMADLTKLPDPEPMEDPANQPQIQGLPETMQLTPEMLQQLQNSQSAN